MKRKQQVKSVFKEAIAGIFIIFILTNIISYLRKPTLESDRVPHIEAVLVDGSRFSVPEGKPLVIHFWATWCPTCKLEAANIEKVSETYEVLTIAVNSGTTANIKTYKKEKGLTFRVLNDMDGRWAKQFRVEAFPTTFIYDAKGKLRFTEVGYTTTAGLLARLKMIE